MAIKWNRALLPLIALFTVGMISACTGSEAERVRSAAGEGGAAAESAAAAAAGSSGNVIDDGDKFEIADAPQEGAAEAAVIIVEWSSFQCPFCGRVQPTIAQLLERFPNDVRFAFKQHPLPMQAQSRPAAIASLAAHRQGKFFEYKALLMANQRNLSDDELAGYAEQVGLDMDQFRADIADAALNAQVDADLAVAGRYGIRGTPNFMINGRNLAGAQPIERFEEVIREEIAAVRGLQEGGKSLSEALAARMEANAAAPAPEAAPARPSAPDPSVRLRVPVGEAAVRGNADALVTIVEFSSYQCPFCGRVQPTLDQLAEQYGDDLRLVFKQRPLDFQANSQPAARAAVAAQNQGKFWEFHAALFENSRSLNEETFNRIAQELGLDMARFQADFASPETAARVAADSALADQLQASGTPHFFINGMRLVGAQPIEAFKALIDQELANARGVVEGGVARSAVYDNLMASAAERPAPAAAAPAAPAAPANIPAGNSPSRGPEDASVTVIEFSDFQCGFCSRLAATLDEVMPDYVDRVRFVSKQFPLGRWEISQVASRAALAANEQGKYWEFKALVYQNQRGLQESQLTEFAEQLGLNMDRFREDFTSGRFDDQIRAEQGQGRGAGVSGTPALFINGRQVGGAIPAERLRQELDAALAN